MLSHFPFAFSVVHPGRVLLQGPRSKTMAAIFAGDQKRPEGVRPMRVIVRMSLEVGF